jgi:predicted TIM-barrel fold metal-dependent hydrolase
MVVIDAHSHLLQGRHPSSERPQSLDDLDDVDVVGLLAGLDELGVEAVVTLAQEMTRVRDQWLGSNELAADLQQRLQGRFYGIAGFEPLTRWDQFNGQRFEQVRELVQSDRVQGLLITPPYGHFRLNDRRAYPFYQLAVEYDVPIYVHQGAMFGPPQNAPQYGGGLWTLDQVVVDLPDLRLNIEHMAWPWTEELLAIMAHGPNVTTDVTMLSMRPHLLAWHLTIAGDYGFLDRIFWGTDYVGQDSQAYLDQVRQELDFYQHRLNPILKGCGWPTLSAVHIEGLLGENIRRFLKLTL